MHVVAIACGRKQPYVEENYRFAEQCLWVTLPSGLGILAGAGVRVALAAFGWFRRKSGAPVRFLPRTTRDVMVTVACIGVGLGCLHRVFFPPTIYASGYDDARFHAIREGMTGDQVASALGPPLEKHAGPDGREYWIYSEQYTYTSDYNRRWIILEDGLVLHIESYYYID